MLFRGIASDFRTALRSLARSAGFTASTVATLAIGIGAVSTIFGVVKSAFRDPPFADVERLVAISESHPGGPARFSAISERAFQALLNGTRSFDRVGAYQAQIGRVAFGDAEVRLNIASVDSAVFGILGVQPRLGRLFVNEEYVAEASVAVISDALWRDRFASDPDVLGRSIRIDGITFRVIAVMPQGFGFPGPERLWIPRNVRPNFDTFGVPEHGVVARLRGGISRSVAQAELDAVAGRLAADSPDAFAGMRLTLRSDVVNRGPPVVRAASALFLLAAAFVLLVACANIANLTLVRAAERTGQFGIRLALGATRFQIVRFQVVESLILCGVAGVAGGLITIWSTGVLTKTVVIPGMPAWVGFGVDVGTVTLTVGLTIGATMLIASLPAHYGSRLDVGEILKQRGGASTRPGRLFPATRAAVVVQVALSISLFIGAALLANGYRRLTSFEAGFDAEHVLRGPVTWPTTRADGSDREGDVARLVLSRAAGLPVLAGIAVKGTFEGWRDSLLNSRNANARGRATSAAVWDAQIYLPGAVDTPADRGLYPRPTVTVVSSGYFRTLGISLARGRDFGAIDHARSAATAIVSARLARWLWGTDDVLGRVVRLGRTGRPVTIIGVASDVSEIRGTSGRMSVEAVPALYVSLDQAVISQLELLARPVGRAGDVLPALRRVLASVDPTASIGLMEPFAEQERRLVRPVRIMSALMMAFAVCALSLGLIGVHGVVRYAVVQRTPEIGIRLALGATPGEMQRMVMRDAIRLVVIGVSTGLALGIGITMLVAHFLWGVSAFTPLVYLEVAGTFVLVALVACYLPARRAARIDPLTALQRL